MQKANPPQGNWLNVVFFLVALLVIAADQLTKLWIRSNLAIGESLPETGLFRLTRIYNTGAAFGLFQGQSFVLTIVAIIAVIALILFVLFGYHQFPFLDERFGKPTLGLLLGGIASNLIDRLYLGYVTDFIDIGVWPAFNVADSSITVGAILFAYTLLFVSKAK